MKNKTLLIMAAGMGSRFGGLKQIEPVGPNDEFIIDYSIYDAKRCGFNKIVFIIKEENYEVFRKTIGSRVEGRIPVEYVFQKKNDIPEGHSVPEERVKPLGTAHAIYSARNAINEQFMIINADDFYGYEAFLEASKYMDSVSDEKEIGLVCYNVINTVTDNGSVKRGICNIENGYLKSIDESIVVKTNILEAESLDTKIKKTIKPDTKVSMNMMMFFPNIFNYIEKEMINFFENKDVLKDEFLIPDVVSHGIEACDYKVKIINTNSKWVGVTYKADKEEVVNYINNQIKEKVYPNKLWEK